MQAMFSSQTYFADAQWMCGLGDRVEWIHLVILLMHIIEGLSFFVLPAVLIHF